VPRGGDPGPRDLQYVVDFDGPALRALPPDAEVEPIVSADANARIVERNAYRNEAAGGWRMTVRIDRIDPTRPVELRAFLRHRDNTLTETWTTIIPSD
jgi:glucans biosynthesis protein